MNDITELYTSGKVKIGELERISSDSRLPRSGRSRSSTADWIRQGTSASVRKRCASAGRTGSG